MTAPRKIVAFAASNSRASINKQLVTHAATVAKEEIDTSVEITVLDLNDFEMPIYSIDRENKGGVPEAAKAFFGAIGQADYLMISYAEHNGYYTAAFKNIFDWCSRIDMKVFQDKPMLIMSSSPGAGGGANVLKAAKDSAGVFGADIRGSMSVATFGDNFDTETQRLVNPELGANLREQLALLFG